VIKLLNLFVEIRDAIVLFLCILISSILIITGENTPVGPFRILALKSIGEIGGFFFDIGSYFSLRDQVSELRAQNADLSYENMQMEDALLENLRLRKLLGFRDKSEFHLIPAEIIGQSPHTVYNGLILNEGQSRGIEKEDAVLTAEGLVGRIVIADRDQSICEILLDRNSRVSAKIQRNREQGIVAWDGGAQLKLLYVAKTIEVLVGDVVITSGYSQVFPENIKIGVVVSVSKETSDMFQEISIQPSVNFHRLEEVQVVKKGSKSGN
jgi:rod shape-determining protein MreC